MPISFCYGQFQDETDVGLGSGWASVIIDNKKGIIINDFPIDYYKATAYEAKEFVKENWDQFFQDPAKIIEIIEEYENSIKKVA